MILQAFIRGAIVILVAALISTLLRHRSAALRHHVWATAVVVQLAILVFIPVLPTIHLPLIPTLRVQEDAPLEARGTTEFGLVTQPPANLGAVKTAETPSEAAAVQSGPVKKSRTLSEYLLLVWIAGGAIILGRFLIGTLLMTRIALKGERVEDGEWLVLAQRTARELGITRPITMIWGDQVAVPITWGVLYPMILLPKNAQEWTHERRRFVLVHEMAHVKRFDAFTQLLAQLTTALFWFSPFVWIAEWRMRIEREHACDDTVIQHGTEPTRYADELLQMVRTLVRRRTPQPAFAALAMARKSEFEGRMLAILDPERPRRVTGITSGVAFAMLSVLIAAPLAAVNPFAFRVITSPKAATPLVAAPPTSNLGDCEVNSNSDQTSADTHDDAVQVRIKRGVRCAFVDVSGPVRLSPDDRRILGVETGGMVRVRETTPERATQLIIERPSVGSVKRSFTINGRTPDDDGSNEREWLARVLPELLAEGAIRPQERVLNMLKSHGLAGTLREISAISSPASRFAHFRELVEIGDWSPAEIDRIRAAGNAALGSAPKELAAFNRAFPIRVSSESVAAPQSDVELLDKILAGITSSYDLSNAMLSQVRTANREALLVFARHAARMTSDYDLRTFLVAAGPHYFGKDRTLADTWFKSASNIGSSYERRVVLLWAIPHIKKDGPSGTLAVLNATRSMTSGYDKAIVLAEIAKEKLINTPELRTAFLAEVNTLPAGSDRRTVLEAL